MRITARRLLSTLRERSRPGASAISIALSASFGALLVLLATTQPPRDDARSLEEPSSQVEVEPSVQGEKRADSESPSEALAMMRVLLPPPPASPRVEAPQTNVPKRAPAPEPIRAAPLAPPSPPSTPPTPITPVALAANEPREAPALRRAALEPAPRTEPEPVSRAVVNEAPAEPVEARGGEGEVSIRVGDVAAPEAVDGRALLLILEHGSGPEIEIAWPSSGGQRESLYALLSSCYGVETALLDLEGGLYVSEAVSRTRGSWTPNMDRYSGFVREVHGKLSRSERGRVSAIERRHPEAAGLTTVRLFPRNVDAVLLGGLRRLVGEEYGTARRIHARYEQQGNRVVVRGVGVNGRSRPGRIELEPPGRCSTS